MRIQHNIMAMNAYRNYNNNNSALSKNLEKLSSGYAINRAGDDAAGLAISEKMRAQITGLDTAQQNAESGINLVQTAEGALTEVHDMLNRMYELSSQSANGTYDQIDRDQLQKEVEELQAEIDRIADSTNFNGIQLLDGSLSSGGATGAAAAAGAIDLDANLGDTGLAVKDVAATKGEYKFTFDATAISNATLADGNTIKVTISMDNGDNVTLSLKRQDNTDGTAGGKLVGEDGTVYGTYSDAGTGATTKDLSKALTAALKDSELAEDFKFSVDTGTGEITVTNRVAGADAPKILPDVSISVYDNKGVEDTTKADVIDITDYTPGEDAYQTIDADQFKVYTGKDTSVLEINGKKFAIIVAGMANETDLIQKANEAGVEVIKVANVKATAGGGGTELGDGTLQLNGSDGKATNAVTNTDKAAQLQGDAIAKALSDALGMDVTFKTASKSSTATTNTNDVKAMFVFKKDVSSNVNGGGAGLTLQIGDTSDSYNKLTVEVDDMHVKNLGLSNIDISEQDGAQAAMDKIKAAINQVSDVRGTLGAAQNRLEHTINNLSVTEENITEAESSIRDTDVADEMMAYTKNNILIQSAQAMLAQANQVPQGVLQLLG